MGYKSYYTKGWKSGEAGGTPITPEALNHMDHGIQAAYEEAESAMAYAEASAASAKTYTESAAASVMSYAKKVGAPVNLLVNSYWKKKDEVVNQRNATSYTGVKNTIDRWRSNSPNLTVTLPTDTNGYLTLKNSTTGTDRQTFSQYIGPAAQYVGKTLTIAVCGRADKVSCFSKVVPELTGAVQNFCSVAFDIVDETADQYHTARLHINENGDLHFTVMVHKVQTANLRWAAVYEGEYTADTVPECQPQEYVHALMACKLYAQRLSIYGGFRCFKYDANSFKFLVPVPLRMRVKPSIESGTMSVKNLSGATQNGFTFSVGSFGENYIIIDAAKSGHGLTDAYLYFDSNVIMSADYL